MFYASIPVVYASMLLFLLSCIFLNILNIRELIFRASYLCVFTSEEALLKSTVHGQRNEHQQSFVSQESECGQEGSAERLISFGLPKFSGCISIDVIQEDSNKEHGQNPHTCRGMAQLGYVNFRPMTRVSNPGLKCPFPTYTVWTKVLGPSS